MRILSIEIERVTDTSPDTSWIGEYSHTPGPNAIDRVERGDVHPSPLYRYRCYRYFNPAMSGEETGNPESPEQDYQRMESFSRGDWHFLGIIVKAEVEIGGVVQKITSGGLWEIESDSEESYLESIEKEQAEKLFEILGVAGFTQDEIKAAYENCEVEL